MMKRIDHVGVVVKSIEDAVQVYSKTFGFRVTESYDDPKGDFRSVMINVNGVSIELLEPSNPDGGMGRFLVQKGGGLHHLSIEVDDIDRAMETCRVNGAALLGATAETVGSRRIAFIHPRSAAGVLIELVERNSRPISPKQ